MPAKMVLHPITFSLDQTTAHAAARIVSKANKGAVDFINLDAGLVADCLPHAVLAEQPQLPASAGQQQKQLHPQRSCSSLHRGQF